MSNNDITHINFRRIGNISILELNVLIMFTDFSFHTFFKTTGYAQIHTYTHTHTHTHTHTNTHTDRRI